MNNIKKLIAATLIGISLVSFSGCSIIEKTPEAVQKQVVAIVGDEKITVGQLDEELEAQGAIAQLKSTYGEDFEGTEEGKTQLSTYRQQVLTSIVNTELLKKYAQENKLAPSEEELKKSIDEQYSQMEESYGGADAFKTTLEQYGYTEETFRESIKDNLIATAAHDDIVKDLKAEEYSEDNFKEDDFRKENKDSVIIQYIVTDDEEAGKAAKEKLDNGEAFADVAKDTNIDSSASNGGYLGVVAEDSNYDATFIEKALALKEGETTEIFNGAEDGSYADTSFILRRLTLDEAVPYAKVADKEAFESTSASDLQTKQSEALNKKLEELKKEYNVKTYENKIS